jgi:glutamate dehydrogenase (NAD(P)+)
LTAAFLQRLKQNVEGATIALQGFGNVGTFTAQFLHAKGAKIVAITDQYGGISNREGLDIPALLQFAREHETVKGFPGGSSIGNDELLTSAVDVLIPAALGGVLTRDNARDVRARYIVEAANNPTAMEADEIFEQRKLPVLPDILANAGGVTASYFEWVQNRQHFRWDLARVRSELDRILLEGFEKVWKIAEDKKVSLRTAAYLLGIGRVGRATVLAGIS